MTDFRRSASLMAELLRIFKRIVIQARERGDDRVDLALDEFFDATYQAALDAYEADLLEHSGARHLPFVEAT